MNGNIFGERLRNARIMSGLSMDDLVERMNHSISKMAISKYESGAMLPDSSVLISISNALGQNPDYFFRPFTVSLGAINFRKKSSLSIKAENTIKHQVKDFVERYIEIEEICDSSNKSNLEKFSVKDAGDVINVANILVNKWGVGKDGIFSVIDLLEEHSVKVLEIEADMKFDGLCAYLDKYGAVIVVNKNFPSERKRFTALHELGHLILAFDESISDKDQELYCNLFANEMLISKDRLKFLLGDYRDVISYQELKAIQMQYGISCDAIMYKAKQCNIISPNRYKSFCIQKNKSEGFKSMVESSHFKNETTSRFSRLVYKALSSELITESKAASLLNMDMQTVHEALALV